MKKFNCIRKGVVRRLSFGKKEGGIRGLMSIIGAAIDAIARRCRGSAGKTRTRRNAHAEREKAYLREGTHHPAEASAQSPEPGTYERFPYFEFACYHSSGLCLYRSEGH